MRPARPLDSRLGLLKPITTAQFSLNKVEVLKHFEHLESDEILRQHFQKEREHDRKDGDRSCRHKLLLLLPPF